MSQRTCLIGGCGKPAVTRGWCQRHYTRWIRYGDPEGGQPLRAERRPFWEQVHPGPGGCWLWGGWVNPRSRYGQYGHQWAHRYSYELMVGAIPPGLELDHLCRVKLCVNPFHLDPVPHLENVRRSESGWCRRGLHRLEPGTRRCRECLREKELRRSRSRAR